MQEFLRSGIGMDKMEALLTRRAKTKRIEATRKLEKGLQKSLWATSLDALGLTRCLFQARCRQRRSGHLEGPGTLESLL